MKLQNTLIINFIYLIMLSFNSYADTSADKCLAALDSGKLTAALDVADTALKQNPKNREALLCKGRALGTQGNYSAALESLNSAENLSQNSFDSIIGNLLLGNLHKQNQKYPEALASYEKSLSISKAEKNDKFVRINHNLMGETYALKNDLSAALASYQAGSSLAMNDNERADSYERLAATYKALQQYEAAIEYQLKGVMMQKKAGTLDQYADASLELGKIYILAKEYTGAEKILNKLLQFAQDNGGAYYEAKANLYLAQSKAASGDSTCAKSLLADAQKAAKNVGDKDLVSEIEAVEQKLKN